MAKKKKKSDIYENFYFTVDDWCHEYSYGINRSTSNYFREAITEFDRIRIIGRLRNKTKRKFEYGELYLMCMNVPKDRLHEDSQAIGAASLNSRRLQCSALIPIIPFHALPATLAAGKIGGFRITVKNLRYRNGATISFDLRNRLSNQEDNGEKPAELAAELACFVSIDS